MEYYALCTSTTVVNHGQDKRKSLRVFIWYGHDWAAIDEYLCRLTKRLRNGEHIAEHFGMACKNPAMHSKTDVRDHEHYIAINHPKLVVPLERLQLDIE